MLAVGEGVTLQLSVSLDRFLLAELQRERCLLGEPDLSVPLTRRIDIGLGLIVAGRSDELKWRPLLIESSRSKIEIDEILYSALQTAVDVTGFSEEVLISTFASSECCTPPSIRHAEAHQNPTRGTSSRHFVRTEPGRGNIYRASFDVPGYQLAFLTLLGGGELTQSDVLEHAILALAREACLTNQVGSVPITSEARLFSERMLEIAAGQRGRARLVRRVKSSRPARL